MIPTITYGLFDTSTLSPEEIIAYQYITNNYELYGE